MPKNKTGFTLIELLVVIAIIGLLSSIAIVSLSSVRGRARDSKRVADIKSIQLALEVYYDTNRRFPTSDELASGTDSGGTKYLAPRYLPVIPKDPLGQSYAYFQCNYDGNGAGSSTMGSSYLLAASLEDSANSALASDSDYSPAGGISSWCPGAGATFSTANPNPPASSGTACSTSGGSGGDSCFDVKR